MPIVTIFLILAALPADSRDEAIPFTFSGPRA